MKSLINLRRTCISACVAGGIALAVAYARFREFHEDVRLARVKAERRARHEANKSAARTNLENDRAKYR